MNPFDPYNSRRKIKQEAEERRKFWQIPSTFNDSLNTSLGSIGDSSEEGDDDDPRNQSMTSLYSFDSGYSYHTSLSCCNDYYSDIKVERKQLHRNNLSIPLTLNLPDNEPSTIALETPVSLDQLHYTPNDHTLPTPTREATDNFSRLYEKSAKTPFCKKEDNKVYQPLMIKNDTTDDTFDAAEAMLALSNPERTKSQNQFSCRSRDSKRCFSEVSNIHTNSPLNNRNNISLSETSTLKKETKRCKTLSLYSTGSNSDNKENHLNDVISISNSERLAKTIINELQVGQEVVRTSLEKGTLLMVLSEDIEERYFGKERLQKFCQKCSSRDEYNVTSKQWSRMKLKVIAELILTLLADRLQGKLPPKTTPTRPLWVRNYGEALGRLLLSQDDGILRMPHNINANGTNAAIDLQVFTAVFGDSGTTGRTFRSRKSAPRSMVPFDFSGVFDLVGCGDGVDEPMDLEE